MGRYRVAYMRLCSAMKVLLLGAGYGTRLARDLAANGEYPALVGVAKPLLPIGGKPLVSYWMDILLACPETAEEVYVVVRRFICYSHKSARLTMQNITGVNITL